MQMRKPRERRIMSRQTINTARVATIVLNYDNADDTVEAIKSIRYSSNLDQRVIVVDNNPDVAEQTSLRNRLGPGVTYIPTGANIGYAAGNNVGIRRAMEASPEYIWVLNPDVRVAPETLAGLLTAAEATPDSGIIGGRILHGGSSPESIWFDGGIIDSTRYGATSHLHAGKHHASTPSNGIVDVDYVTGASMLIRARAIEQVGMLPEDYFLYFEETDYCKRMQEAGWRTVVDQSVVLSHFKRSSGDLPTAHYLYYMTRNRLQFANTYFSGPGNTAAALADFRLVFLDPWRARVETRAPLWTDVFDEVVRRAIDDAEHGRRGKAMSLQAFPNVKDESNA